MPRDSNGPAHPGEAARSTSRLSWLTRVPSLLQKPIMTSTVLERAHYDFRRSPSTNKARKTSMDRRSASDVFLFLHVLFFAATVPFLLRLKLSRVETLLEPRIPRSASRDRVEQITEYVEMAIRAGSPLVRPGCLTRGVTRYYFFRRNGLDVSLCFGMGEVKEEFVGHCWLVKDGVPFLETRDPRPLYAEMYRISGTAHRGVIPARKTELEQSTS
jgi:hypothetical protein